MSLLDRGVMAHERCHAVFELEHVRVVYGTPIQPHQALATTTESDTMPAPTIRDRQINSVALALLPLTNSLDNTSIADIVSALRRFTQ